MSRRGVAPLAFIALSLLARLAASEIIYLSNGDVLHGTLVAANNTEVTLKTSYGQLVIPKKDIERIDYENAPTPRKETETARPPKAPERVADVGRSTVTLRIRGRSFWYAFDSPAGAPADTSIRLRLYLGSARACTFVDDKPDTVDGQSLYNSFTFSSTDARLTETLAGFECSVEKTATGEIRLRVGLSADASSGRQLIRMAYEVNEGDRTVPRWVEVASSSFSAEVAPGKNTEVVLEQNSDALQYTGFFKKKMKNVELFQVKVLSTELKD